MSNTDSVHRTELPKIIDDGTNNNYGEWETKSYHKFREWNLLKYIEGPASEPPIIPPLHHTVTHHGVDDDGNVSSIRVPGNLAEHKEALTQAEPWMTGNNTALSRIVAAVPSHQLHLVKRVTYAKQAWESLRSVYQPRNSLRAATMKGQIMAYCCQSDMNVARWLNDMQRLYNSLCDLDNERMTDRDFALAILDLMPQDDGWRDFLSNLRTKVRDSDAQSLPIDSTTFVTAIRDEYWYRHKDDYQTTSHIFSARFEAQKRSNAQKRGRNSSFDLSNPSSTPTKRACIQNPDKPIRECTNPHCGAPRGHDTKDCIAYKGAKEGQYGDWWHGPWNIHLPPSQRTSQNNTPPKSHPDYARVATPKAQSNLVDGSLDRSATAHIMSDDDSKPTQANAALLSDPTCYAWNTQLDDNIIQATLPVLNLSISRDNTCHHDSGANCHVFHDRSVFEQYEAIQPLTVKGFGHNLSTVAIGQGSVCLEGRYGTQRCTVVLTNVLHIPAARSNLISSVQLDKAGVVSTLGNKTITLSVNGKPLVGGEIVNDMYRLYFTVIPPSSLPLASRLAPLSLASRIGPKIKSCDTPPPNFYTAS